jgi:uncharacterized protein (TIGR02266 family)
MGKKGKGKTHRRKTAKAPTVAAAPPSPPPAPAPEQLIGALVEAIAPPLFEGLEEHETSAPAPRHTISPRGVEHRAHPRVPVTVAIGLESESHFFSGLSGDISEGGVFVQTYRDLPLGAGVEVHFDLPDGELKAHGRVRWHRSKSDSSPPGVAWGSPSRSWATTSGR